tara:strand:+ start:1482 stop:9860 length:8379 start_codon:yes stop_codon:yes gene_type:complete
MYGNFEGWLQDNGYPWESFEESRARYESLYGEDDKEVQLTSTPAYTYEPEEEPEEEGFLDSFLGGNEYLPSLSEFGNAAAKSWDETQASGATIAETLVAPSLDYLGFEETADDIKEWAPEYREKQLAEAAQYPDVQNKLQKALAEDPNYTPAETREQTLARLQAEGSEWYNVAKNVPEWIPLTLDKAIEDSPTAGEVGSFAAGSAVPMIGAAAVGLPALALGGGAVLAGGLAMGVGALMSSALVSSETAENIKNNPVVRKALGIEDNRPFEELPSVTQQKIMKVAEDGAQSNLGQRLISSGIPEMLGYIPAGGPIFRAVVDIAGGTTSEVWDISVSRESMISALLENGVDPNLAGELNSALEAIGPKKSEVFMKALVGEAVATGGITSVEQLVINKLPKYSHQVDGGATTTKKLAEEQKETQKGEIKIREAVSKKVLEVEGNYGGQVETIIDLFNSDPDSAARTMENLKTYDRATQNGIQKDMARRYPAESIAISNRIADLKVREDFNKIIEAEAKKQQAKDEKLAQKEAKEVETAVDAELETNKKDNVRKNAVATVNDYNKKRKDELNRVASGDMSQELYQQWEIDNRPEDEIKIIADSEKSLKAEADKKTKADKATVLADKQAKELADAVEKGTQEDTDKQEAKVKVKPKVEVKAKIKAEPKVATPVEEEPKTKRQIQTDKLKAKAEEKKAETATPVVETTPVEADEKLVERYKKVIEESPNKTLRNPDNTLKEVTLGDQKFTGEELRALDATKKAGGTESYSVNQEWGKFAEIDREMEKESVQRKEYQDAYDAEAKTEADAQAKAPRLRSRKSKQYADQGHALANVHEILDADSKTVVKRIAWEGESNTGGMGRWIDVDEGIYVTNEKGLWAFNKKDAIEYIGGGLGNGRLKSVTKNLTNKARDKAYTKLLSKEKESQTSKMSDAELRKKAFLPSKTSPMAGLNAAMDTAVEAVKKKNPKATEAEIEEARKKAQDLYIKDNKESVVTTAPDNAVTNLIEPKKENTKQFKTISEVEEALNDFTDEYVKKKADAYSSVRKKGEKKNKKPTAKMIDTWSQEAIDSFVDPNDKGGKTNFSKTKIRYGEQEGKYTLEKNETIELVKDFVARTPLKDKDVEIITLSKESTEDIATLTEEVGEASAKEGVESAEALITDSGKIFLITENIRGVKVAIDGGFGAGGKLMQVLFHEIIGHLGLKKFLGTKYNTFISRFIKTNKKAVDNFAINGKGKDYLPESIQGIENAEERREAYNTLKKDEDKSVKDVRNKTEFTMAEEYIAINFAENGARDPNIVKRIVVSLRNFISSVPMFEDMGITTDQVKVILAGIQQEYIGGKRNFITGEDFPVTTSAPKDTTEEEGVESVIETEVEAEARQQAVDDEIETLTVGDSEVRGRDDKEKVNMSKKDSAFDKVLQRAEEKAKLRPQGTSAPEKAGVAYRVKISDAAVEKYLENKSEEAPSIVGVMRLPNMSKMSKDLAKELKGQVAVGMLADRLIRGEYQPVHKGSEIKIFLGGGPLYAFDTSKKNLSKNGRAVWASEPQSTTKVVNAIKRTGAKYGYILVGKDDMHLSNLDVWDVATQEALDSVKFDGATIESLDQSAKDIIDNLSKQIDGKTGEVKNPSVKALQGKVTTFKELMAKGDDLSFDARKPILNYIFGAMRSKKNKHINIKTIKERTSQYPNSEAGDLVGILKFHSDKSNFRTTAEELGVQKHRSYSSILQGEGLHKFETPIPLKEFGREWLMEKRRSYNEQGKLVAFQRPFWEKGQVDFEDNLIYSAEFISYITGEKVTSGDSKGKVITKKPSKDKRTKTRGTTATKAGALRSIDYKSPTFDIDLIVNSKVNMSKIASAQDMNSYKAATVAQGRMSEDGLYWIPTFTWQDKLSNKLTKRLIAQGTLPDSEIYKDIRRKNKGVVFQAQQAGEKLFKILSKSKQQKILYDFFVTPRNNENGKGNPELITDPKERQAAIDAKAQIQQIGRDLVTRGLMTQESLEKFDDQYLPRKYLKYLLKDKDYRAIDKGGAGVQLDLSYLNARKDIPAGIRELILGEVKDPAFLSSIAISTPIRDMAILDMFESIAGNKDWILPSTLVKFDILGELKRLSGNDTKLIEALQLYNTADVRKEAYNKKLKDAELALDKRLTEPEKLKKMVAWKKENKAPIDVKVSGHWLLNESERIRELVDNHMVLSDKNEKLVRKLINTMTTKGNEILKGVVIPGDFKRIPKGKKYGRLSGMAIRKEIFEDMFGWGTNSTSFDINADGTVDASWAEKVLGTGGTFEQYNRLWKWSKVSANPPSWVRNFVSNLVFMSLGPVPMHRLPDLFLRSINDQIKTRKVEYTGTQREFDAMTTYTKIADEMGLTSGGFSQAELKTIRNEFVSSKSKASGPMSLLKIRDAFKSFQRGTSDVYGGIDTLGKVMVLKYLMEQGSTKEVAAAQAEKFLFDYSNPLSSVKYLRKSAFGAPFLSYPSFVAPVLIETIIKRPWKFLPYIIMAEVTKSMFKEEQDVSDEEYQGVMSTLSDYLHKRANEKGDLSVIPESVLPLPHKDSLGRAQVVDVGYFYPWGMFSEILRQLNPFKEEGSEITGAMHSLGLMGSPLLNIAVTSLTGRDPFTDRQIHDELSTSGEKYASWFNYAFNLTLPPMFHGLSPVGSTDGFVGMGAMKNPDAGGFGALTRLYQAYNNKVGREGEPKFTEAQAWLRMVGLNVTPLAPFEARGKQVNFEINKIKKLQRALKIKFMKGMQAQYSKEELKDLVQVELDRINRQVEKLNKRISKPLPASLKRSKKDMLKSREKYLRYLKLQKAG